MFNTAFTLSLSQFARCMSIPERLQKRAGRNATLEGWRLRNTGLDALYYDIKALTPEEVFYVSDAIAAEGLMMIVPPTGGPMLTICDSVDEYVLRGGGDVHIMAVAGVGGSALGAAAFARNVADAMGEPVAAVVSGYGLGDILHEAIGGALFFGVLGNIRDDLEVLDDVVGRPRLGAYGDRDRKPPTEPRRCLDVDTVGMLLGDARLSFHLLTGHSKGNLVLSHALYGLRKSDPDRLSALAQRALIVTFAARITMPPEFSEVVDVIGELDWYGEMNSRPRIDTDIRLPLTGHTTNTDLYGAIRVTKVLKEIIDRRLPVAVDSGHALAAVERHPPPAVIDPAPQRSLVEATPVASAPVADAPVPEVLVPEAPAAQTSVNAAPSADAAAEIDVEVLPDMPQPTGQQAGATEAGAIAPASGADNPPSSDDDAAAAFAPDDAVSASGAAEDAAPPPDDEVDPSGNVANQAEQPEPVQPETAAPKAAEVDAAAPAAIAAADLPDVVQEPPPVAAPRQPVRGSKDPGRGKRRR